MALPVAASQDRAHLFDKAYKPVRPVRAEKAQPCIKTSGELKSWTDCVARDLVREDFAVRHSDENPVAHDHDVSGSFARALDTLRRAREAGLRTSVNTQIGAETMTDLPELMDTIVEVGAKHWQI